MGKETAALSQVVPILVAVLVCDIAVADPVSGKKNLIGVFDKILVDKFPAQRPMSLYAKVADANGYYKTEIRYIHTNSGNILAKAEGDLKEMGGTASTEMFINFPPLPIPEAGTYEFQVWANSVFLGQTSINVVQKGE